MEENRKEELEELSQASPLEITNKLEEFEMYDKKSSQEIIDEVYAQFETGEHMTDSILKPVFTSVIDGLLEATSAGRSARKKGLSASRVLQECEEFSYDGVQENGTTVEGYTEDKNASENDSVNSNMTQEYNKDTRSKLYEDKTKMDNYKKDRILGEKTLVDEYTGLKNLYYKQDNPNQHYNDETHRKQAQPDHIVPLKQIHDKFKGNYALDDTDIKSIANFDDNFAVTSAGINQVKKELSNAEYIRYMEKIGTPVDDQTKRNMIKLQKKAEKAVDSKANEAVFNNLTGKGGETKQKEILGTANKNALNQAKDYAVGNIILFIVKPLYYEISDIFKNGMIEGVGSDSTIKALKIRFGRVKKYVLENYSSFIGDNILDFVKGFISSLIEGIISLFVGVFKQVLKLLKEGIKIFVQSAKILFGKDSKEMSAAEKGDAIIKLIGGSVIAISGIAIEALLNKIGIGDPWATVLSTMLSGIASALFMYLLDKADLFSTKAEKRKERIEEIFNERIQEIQKAANDFDIVAIQAMRNQFEQFEVIKEEINYGLSTDNIDTINSGLYRMADFYKVDLPYSNTSEFVEYFDSEEIIEL